MTLQPSAPDGSALEWIKSSYSDSDDGNQCVEAASTPRTVHIRDSKNAQGPELAFAHSAWAGFVSYTARA